LQLEAGGLGVIVTLNPGLAGKAFFFRHGLQQTQGFRFSTIGDV
jgi:hypothetical protein